MELKLGEVYDCELGDDKVVINTDNDGIRAVQVRNNNGIGYWIEKDTNGVFHHYEDWDDTNEQIEKAKKRRSWPE